MSRTTDPRKLRNSGLVGALAAALCCFTPLLVVLAGATGLSAIVGYLDYVLLPALGGFIALVIYAQWKMKRQQNCCDKPEEDPQ